MIYYLGVHRPSWLPKAGVPLFLSDTVMRKRKSLPRAAYRWALDSGGFSEIHKHGRWTQRPEDYVARVRRYADEVGRLDFAAPQDWMCEPQQLAKTGLTVPDHQVRTIDSVVQLRTMAPGLPWLPVLQGWEPDDYLRHRDAYAERGIDLTQEPRVGVGSVCRRQSTKMAESLIHRLSADGISVHAFGFKRLGLPGTHRALGSADSMAWSYRARRSDPLPGCTHRNCANCLRYALQWRAELLERLGREEAA